MIKLNHAHAEDKEKLSSEQLKQLEENGFTDDSWGNNECASFISKCEHYQIFCGFSDECEKVFTVLFETDDSDTKAIGNGSDDLGEILTIIENHKSL
jgi:hypothetical protein